jgi:hypothetical protein
MPDALEADGKDDIIAGAKADRLPCSRAVIDGHFALENQAFFGLIVFPVELVSLMSPDRPGCGLLTLGGSGFSNDNVTDCRHCGSFQKII